MTGLIILGIVVVYTFIGGFIGKILGLIGEKNNWDHVNAYYLKVFGGIFWPMAIIVMAGNYLAKFVFKRLFG